jgi:hypothetical protein
MAKDKVICTLCNKPFADLKSHQKNIHKTELKRLVCPLCDSNSVYNDSGLKKHYQEEHPEVDIETKLPKPTMKSLKLEILGLEDQLKVSNNQNTNLRDEMSVRVKENDVENERLRRNNIRISNNFNRLAEISNKKSLELNKKYALLESECQGYRDRYDIFDHGHEKKTLLCLFFIDLFSPR